MTRRLSAILALVAAATMAGVATSAPAAAGAPKPTKVGAAPERPAASFGADVSVLLASNGRRGIDPRIGDMPELAKPPFSSYAGYTLLRKIRLPLRLGDSKTFALPNGRLFQAKLLQVLPNDQVRLSASIEQPGGGAFLPLLEVKAKRGQAFIVAGQSYKGGTLVLVIRVGA